MISGLFKDLDSELLKRLLKLCPIIDLEEDFHPFNALVPNCLFQLLYLLQFSVHANLEKVVLLFSLRLCQERVNHFMLLISVLGLSHVSMELKLRVSSALLCFVFLLYYFVPEANLIAESSIRQHSTSIQSLSSKELFMLVFFGRQYCAYR